MLRRVSIPNRSPGELQRLAAERRELAVGKEPGARALLLNEAHLLEFHAELRLWMQRIDPRPARAGATPIESSSGEPAWLLSPDLAPFLTRLRSRMALPIPDQHALLAAAMPPRKVERDETILEEGELQPSLLFLCSGTARAYRTLEDGSQQNVALFLAGDALNPGDLALGVARNAICALAPSIVLEIPYSHLMPLIVVRPKIVRALWMETALRSAIQREWIIWLGRRSAEARLAHFICEISYRLQLGGDEDAMSFQFPLTQRELADTIGLSTVHVNRVLQALRRQRVIVLERNRLIIRNKQALYALAEFDPGYLHVVTFSDRGEEC